MRGLAAGRSSWLCPPARAAQRGVSAMTVDGRGTRRGWTVHGHDACSKRRALTYVSWPTSATAIRLEWLSGARALARARTCTEPSRLANLAQQPIAVSHRLWPSHSYVAGDERTQRAQARHREGRRTTKFAIDNAERPTQIFEHLRSSSPKLKKWVRGRLCLLRLLSLREIALLPLSRTSAVAPALPLRPIVMEDFVIR